MYNRLKTFVNQVCNLGSTKWDDHEMVKVILRSLVFCNPTQVQLIRGDPRYKLMSPEEVIGKFVSFELLSKAPNTSSTWSKAPPPHPRCNPSHSKRRKRRKRSLHRVGFPSTPLSSTMRKWRSSSRAFAKSSNKGGGRTTNPALRGCVTNVVSPVILLLNVQCLVIVTEATTRRGRRRKRRCTTRRRAAMPTCVGNGTPTRDPLTPPPTRMPPTSSLTRASSSQTSATSASWQRTTKRRRYNLEPPPSILHLVMRVVLVMMKMICLLFLLTLTCNKNKN
jgi:hypothetical protein